ncbi:MAG: SemiSWEET transporter [Maribacter dokdonensis]|uniref:SemiSWEET family sugar transporter n=1 Tax=Maribacter dokdonensis TaxID=320912 RepID=UPI0027354B6D|nr:SemiSWEET transporter [Maribacter dokdonensis]MDP2526374.1 SemiSWEET transporter [Maribacter dokdonensis]|tara:strand:+ start:405 stop:677 length:273 start_codon:yes stop_codon:yes gene_type:complete
MEEIIGIFAGVFTTIAAVPQIYRAWKTKKVDDVSPKMFFILILGVLLWTVYGVMKQDAPIIITNGISTLLNITMFILIFKYRNQDKNPTQ